MLTTISGVGLVAPAAPLCHTPELFRTPLPQARAHLNLMSASAAPGEEYEVTVPRPLGIQLQEQVRAHTQAHVHAHINASHPTHA